MAFDFRNPYPTVRIPVFARNVVATSHPLAVQAGLRMLAAGGNAVDAALAGAAMLVVVEPVSCGLGGDAFAIVWDGSRLHGLNAAGPAPAAWSPAYFRDRYGEDGRGLANRPIRGWDSVTVPGVIAGWTALHRTFGRLPFADLLSPALEQMYGQVEMEPPSAQQMTICYGFVCRLRFDLVFTSAERAAITGMMNKGRGSPAEERKALAAPRTSEACFSRTRPVRVCNSSPTVAAPPPSWIWSPAKSI